jgi:hypothetical protein
MPVSLRVQPPPGVMLVLAIQPVDLPPSRCRPAAPRLAGTPALEVSAWWGQRLVEAALARPTRTFAHSLFPSMGTRGRVDTGFQLVWASVACPWGLIPFTEYCIGSGNYRFHYGTKREHWQCIRKTVVLAEAKRPKMSLFANAFTASAASYLPFENGVGGPEPRGAETTLGSSFPVTRRAGEVTFPPATRSPLDRSIRVVQMPARWGIKSRGSALFQNRCTARHAEHRAECVRYLGRTTGRPLAGSRRLFLVVDDGHKPSKRSFSWGKRLSIGSGARMNGTPADAPLCASPSQRRRGY